MKLLASWNKSADPYIDCSDFASWFKSSVKGGHVYEIKPKLGKWIKGIEFGENAEFTYHQFFVKNGWEYDPMYGSSPVRYTEFLRIYKQLNPSGVTVSQIP